MDFEGPTKRRRLAQTEAEDPFSAEDLVSPLPVLSPLQAALVPGPTSPERTQIFSDERIRPTMEVFPGDPKFLSKGAFGCVVSPAIVFPGSEVVNFTNRNEFVTKLGVNLFDEYDLAMAIQDIVGPSVGIFPVDDMIFDVKISDLGSEAKSITSRCTEIGNVLKEPSKRGSYFLKAGSQKTLPQDNFVCAIQFPKYVSNFEDLVDNSRSFSKGYRQMLFQKSQDMLRDKLNVLHSKHILHLDIKTVNVGVLQYIYDGTPLDTNTFKQADFGLARFTTTNEEIFRAYKWVFGKIAQNFYKHITALVRLPWDDLSRIALGYALLAQNAPTEDIQTQVCLQLEQILQLIDSCCLGHMCLQILEGLASLDVIVQKFQNQVGPLMVQLQERLDLLRKRKT